MGTITPTGVINLLKGVPLDNKYNETLYVASDTTEDAHVSTFLQSPYWDANDPYSHYNNHEYQRVNDGILRLKAPISAVYNVNYMIFKNLGTNATYPNHWFFAFVNKVEYVNEQAVNLYYEIDVFQTYCLDWTLEPCLIERAHTKTDVIGEHLAAEPVDLGLMVCTKTEEGEEGVSRWFDQNSIIVFYIPPTDEENDNDYETGYLIDGVYTGLTPVPYDADFSGVSSLNTLIQDLIDASATDRVVAITEFPTAFLPPRGLESIVVNSNARDLYVSRPNNIDGYTPKNNKLFTAPYVFFNVDVQTDSKTYRYELFTDPTNCHFMCSGALAPNPEIRIVPYGYNKTNILTSSPTDALIMDGFPQCGFAIDGYRAYLAQKAVDYQYQQMSNVVSIATGLGVTALGAATENPAGVLGGTSQTLQSVIGAAQAAFDNACEQNKGSSARGSLNSSALFGAHQRSIYVRHMSITSESAKMIDDFFSRFGYAINRIATPDIAARTKFTYIKTNGMSIHGNIPSDDMKKINESFDHGITFFKDVTEIGNYGLSNTPVGGVAPY